MAEKKDHAKKKDFPGAFDPGAAPPEGILRKDFFRAHQLQMGELTALKRILAVAPLHPLRRQLLDAEAKHDPEAGRNFAAWNRAFEGDCPVAMYFSTLPKGKTLTVGQVLGPVDRLLCWPTYLERRDEEPEREVALVFPAGPVGMLVFREGRAGTEAGPTGLATYVSARGEAFVLERLDRFAVTALARWACTSPRD